MRILAVSDIESPLYYDYYTPGMLDKFDLILACGDLHPAYLEFLVTLGRCPVLYVHGNHDGIYQKEPPGGCLCVEDTVYVYNGLRILGLGGSRRYREGPYMYTERQMQARIRRLRGKLWRQGGFDLLLTHAPARGLQDLETPSHQGFQCFHALLDQYHPRYFVHGHIHPSYYGAGFSQITAYGGTTIINAYDHCQFVAEQL